MGEICVRDRRVYMSARNKRVRQTRVCESSTVKRKKKEAREPSKRVPTIHTTTSENL